MNTAQAINGEIRPGDWVVITPSDAFGNLVGQVTKIIPNDSPEHTGGNANDVHVNVAESGYSEDELYNVGYIIDKFGMDGFSAENLVVAPENLINITELAPALRRSFIENGKVANDYCQQMLDNAGYTGANNNLDALYERLDKNLVDYHNSLMDFGARELIDMAGKIAAMTDVHRYMTTTRGFDDEEVDFYLQFQNPLEIVADAWLARNADNEDLCFAMDFVYDKKDALVNYPLMRDYREPDDPGSRRFMGVDLIDFLGKIAGKVIVHNPEDWQSQRNALYRIADTDNPENKRLMWLVSSRGANMYSEQAMFIKGTPAHDKCVDNFPNDSDTFGYVVEVIGRNGDVVIGNVFDVGDYYPYSLHVKENALICTEVSLTYSNDWGVNAGKTVMVPRFEYDDDRHRLMSESGNVTAIQYHPYEAIRTMADVLQQEHSRRMAYPLGSQAAHLKSLSEKLAEIRQPPEQEKSAPQKEKSAFDKALNRGKAKAEAGKAQKASEPTKNLKNKEAIE